MKNYDFWKPRNEGICETVATNRERKTPNTYKEIPFPEGRKWRNSIDCLRKSINDINFVKKIQLAKHRFVKVSQGSWPQPSGSLVLEGKNQDQLRITLETAATTKMSICRPMVLLRKYWHFEKWRSLATLFNKIRLRQIDWLNNNYY